MHPRVVRYFSGMNKTRTFTSKFRVRQLSKVLILLGPLTPQPLGVCSNRRSGAPAIGFQLSALVNHFRGFGYLKPQLIPLANHLASHAGNRGSKPLRGANFFGLLANFSGYWLNLGCLCRIFVKYSSFSEQREAAQNL
jgi:hypothetical protein